MFDVIRKVLEECGYCTDGIEMDTFVHQQSPDIAKAVSVSKECRDNIGAKIRDRSRGAGDQGVMIHLREWHVKSLPQEEMCL